MKNHLLKNRGATRKSIRDRLIHLRRIEKVLIQSIAALRSEELKLFAGDSKPSSGLQLAGLRTELSRIVDLGLPLRVDSILRIISAAEHPFDVRDEGKSIIP